MKVLKNEYEYNIFYEVDDLTGFGDNLTIKDFKKIKHKKVCFVNEDNEILIVELDKKDSFYSFDSNILLLKSGKKYFEINWSGEFHNVMDTSVDDYDIEMLTKIRKNKVSFFTTQF